MKNESTIATELEEPTLPPAAGTPPDRPLPALSKHKHHAFAHASAGPCSALTNDSIQGVIDTIIASLDKAVSDVAANGVTGRYASAARDNLTYLTEARDGVQVLLAWLQGAGLLGIAPDPPRFVSNTTGAYNVHGYVREAVISLHHARHWATISATYHVSADARDSYELTTQALKLIEPLGAQAGRCFMAPYLA